MSSIGQKYAALVEKLYKKTLSSEIEWKHDEGDNFVYSSFKAATVFIEEVQNSNFEPSIEVDIRGGDSGKSEDFNDDDLSGVPSIQSFNSWYELMRDLKDTAMRQATGADARIDALLSELDDEIPF